MTRTAHRLRKGVWIGCFVAIALVATPQAQTNETQSNPHRGMGVIADCQKMMAELKAGERKLDDLIAKMNAATGQQKIDQMAAVLTELAVWQKVMHAHMTMMGHESGPVANAPKEQPQAGHEHQ